MPVPPNPYNTTSPPDAVYKFEIGDIIRILPSSGKWATDCGRDYTECEITDRFYPTNLYGSTLELVGGRPMAAYSVLSLIDKSTGTPWEVDVELVRKAEPPKVKGRKYRSIDDD